MKATAAVMYEVKKPLVIEEVELLDPGPHEVQVRWSPMAYATATTTS